MGLKGRPNSYVLVEGKSYITELQEELKSTIRGRRDAGDIFDSVWGSFPPTVIHLKSMKKSKVMTKAMTTFLLFLHLLTWIRFLTRVRILLIQAWMMVMKNS